MTPRGAHHRRVLLGWVAALIAGVVVLAPAGARAQTIIIDRPMPMPPVPNPRWRPPLRGMRLDVKKLNVDVGIVDGVARTRIDQTFHNPLDRTVEGTFIYPLGDDAAVSRFTMRINGEEVEGKLLSVEEARRTYESIVAHMRDPALLEYVGQRLFQARIFPIRPKSDVTVRLTYTRMLHGEGGLFVYTYPLDLGKSSATRVDEISVSATIQSKAPIKSVFSPSHAVAVSRRDDHHAVASYEATHARADRDFELYYALSDREFGLTLLTYRERGEEGYFLARISPPAAVSERDIVPKDICFVLDRSGSMAGEKIRQARKALGFCLDNLNTRDRFNIIPFSHEATRFADALMPATPENVDQAHRFVEDIKAIGGTNINDALLAALDDAPAGDGDRPYYIVFLTDGQASIGVTHTDELLKSVADRNSARVRLFVFGVGTDVNTKLLDLLAEQNRGTREYVEPGQDLELVLSSFYRKVSDPVLADLSLSFGGLKVHDLYPPKLTDLFGGSELVVTGRYTGSGHQAVTLTGTRRGTNERFVYESSFPEEDRSRAFLPALWATRKVGYLMDEIRLHGENRELKQTIVQLATRYGIITPYTAYLVTERNRMAQRDHDAWLRRGAGGAPPPAPPMPGVTGALEGLGYVDGDADGVRPAMADGDVGRSAIARSREAKRMFDATVAPDPVYVFGGAGGSENDKGDGADGREGGRMDRPARLIEHVGTRTFYFNNGAWIDATYDGKVKTRKVVAFSPEYFELARKNKDLAAAFALGERVIVVMDDVAYETVAPPEPSPPTDDTPGQRKRRE